MGLWPRGVRTINQVQRKGRLAQSSCVMNQLKDYFINKGKVGLDGRSFGFADSRVTVAKVEAEVALVHLG